MPRKPGKVGTVKGENITIRVTPKTKFCLDLLARHQHRSISGVVMAALEPVLKDVSRDLMVTRPGADGSKEQVFIGDLAWDPDPADRLVKLAIHMPRLLTADEEWIWKVIEDSPAYFKDQESKKIPNYRRIREMWDLITETATAISQQATQREQGE